MAWIEQRGRQSRVHWYAQPASKADKTYEAFTSREDAALPEVDLDDAEDLAS